MARVGRSKLRKPALFPEGVFRAGRAWCTISGTHQKRHIVHLHIHSFIRWFHIAVTLCVIAMCKNECREYVLDNESDHMTTLVSRATEAGSNNDENTGVVFLFGRSFDMLISVGYSRATSNRFTCHGAKQVRRPGFFSLRPDVEGQQHQDTTVQERVAPHMVTIHTCVPQNTLSGALEWLGAVANGSPVEVQSVEPPGDPTNTRIEDNWKGMRGEIFT